MESLRAVLGFIRANFFYDARSSILTLSLLLVCFFVIKMLKTKIDKKNKLFANMVGSIVFFVTFVVVY